MSDTNNTNAKKPRHYRLITPEAIALFKSVRLQEGNGSAATRVLHPYYQAPHMRAYRIVKKSEDQNTNDYIEDALQQIGADAVQVLGELVHSRDEKVATKNVHYAIDHLRGKAVQRSESKHLNLTIEAVLD